ncbi:YcxB family protein [Acidovorax lacteus]|uniref:YcxB-like C-terminal domain-containing protein n=1 Tax=Acidovorax lacteus TaxID=1924988 RepID=A0ABP8LAA4_9BURK
MSTTFTLTVADFARLQKVVAKRFRSKAGLFSLQFGLRVTVWLCIGLAGAAYARVMREYPEISQPLGTVAVLLVLALLAIVALPYVAQVSLRKFMLAPNGAFLSPQTVSLSAASVHVSSSTGTTEVPWSGVLFRAEDEANYYLFIDGMQALILPRAAMAPFVAELEQYTAHIKNAI